MTLRQGQFVTGWMIALGIFSVGIIFGGGKIVQSVAEIKASQINQASILIQLTKNETDILTLLARQDERIKFLETR